jgi:hypothetical protein
VRQQRGGDGKHDQTDEDALAPVDLTAEIADREAGKGHAERAGIDGKSHGRRADAVMLGKRGEDGLRREQIDDGQKGRKRDDDEAEQGAGGMLVLLDEWCFDGMGHLSHGTGLRMSEEKWM